MAHVSKQDKIEIANKINPILKKFGLKGSLSVRHHSTLVLTLWSGPINFIENVNEVNKNDPRFNKVTDYMRVNEYYYKEHFTGEALEALSELIPAMKINDWFCDDDIQSDYFHRSYYYDVNIGRFDKPYIYNQPKENETMTTMYASHSTTEICNEIESLKTMVNQVSELNPKFVDIDPIIANISDLANQLNEEMDSRLVA